jgi:hypothetical protein
VFFVPLQREIHHRDTERKQGFGEAERTCVVMLEVYKALGYQLVEVPKLEPAVRARFVPSRLAARLNRVPTRGSLWCMVYKDIGKLFHCVAQGE